MIKYTYQTEGIRNKGLSQYKPASNKGSAAEVNTGTGRCFKRYTKYDILKKNHISFKKYTISQATVMSLSRIFC